MSERSGIASRCATEQPDAPHTEAILNVRGVRLLFLEVCMLKPTPRKRGRAGQADRKRRLVLYPMCAECLKQGKQVGTDQIDHIIPLKDGGPDTDENCRGLCKPCHDAKTAKDMGWSERTAYGEDGWPITKG